MYLATSRHIPTTYCCTVRYHATVRFRPSRNETTGSMEFKTGEWYKVRIRVTAKKIEAWIGDEKSVDVELKGRRVSTRIECEDCQPFGFCTWDTTGAVREIKVRKLTDAEKKGTEKK